MGPKFGNFPEIGKLPRLAAALVLFAAFGAAQAQTAASSVAPVELSDLQRRDAMSNFVRASVSVSKSTLLNTQNAFGTLNSLMEITFARDGMAVTGAVAQSAVLRDVAKKLRVEKGFGALRRDLTVLDIALNLSFNMSNVGKNLTTDLIHSDADGHVTYSVETKIAWLNFAFDVVSNPLLLDQLAKRGAIRPGAAKLFALSGLGLTDIAEGVRLLGVGGGKEIEGVAKLTAGFNKLAWGLVGYVVSHGNTDVALGFASAANLVVAWSTDRFIRAYSDATGLGDVLVAEWRWAQVEARRRGQKQQPIEVYYSNDPYALKSIGVKRCKAANEEFGLNSKPSAQHSNDVSVSTVERRVRGEMEHYTQARIKGVSVRVLLPLPPPCPWWVDCDLPIPIGKEPPDRQPPYAASASTGTDWRQTATRRPVLPVGGVRLDRIAEWVGRPPQIRAAMLDRKTGSLVLVGERGWMVRGLRQRDLAMALWLVYGPDHREPQFSLDPADPANPKGPWLKAVYYPETLRGRSFGRQVFDADLMLKQYGFGIHLDRSGIQQEFRSMVPGFKSYAEMAMDDRASGKEEWSRFWITVDRIVMRSSGDAILFDVRMAVQARRQVRDLKSPTGLSDLPTPPTTLPARWAKMATAKFEMLASEEPAFARVEELAKAVGLAKWLRQRGVTIDQRRILELVNADKTPTPDRVRALESSWRRETRTPFSDGRGQGVMVKTAELHLFGGIDLSQNPKVQTGDTSAKTIQAKVMKAQHDDGASNSYVAEISDGRETLQVAAFPLLQ